MDKMDKLSVIRMCISNDLRAIEELQNHIEKLRIMEQETLLAELVESDEALEAFPL